MKKSGKPFCLKQVLLPVAGMAVLAPAFAFADIQSCKLNSAHGQIKHVIYLQFDNTHFRRDIPNVPSDLEQMPHLLDFIKDNGTLLANDHTILISHTAGGILSTLTGVYPDRHGQPVSNSYVRTSTTGAFTFPSSFGYWTDPVSAANTPTVPNMITLDGLNAPAPWVAYTRAGCDVGAAAGANIVLENVNTTPTGDITKVFGNSSPQQAEADAARLLPNTPANAAAKAKPQTDFVGLAVHCAQGSSVCAGGQADLLPAEPGGYTGFKGLFGAQSINPFLAGGPVVNDLFGNPIADPFGNPGFPGFDGLEATVTLAYVAAMHEKGIPVTFGYISDAHDFHGVAGNQHVAFGPGDAGYVDQLAAYDRAFDLFFRRLAASGITKDNTLFIFTVDEGDHFVGVQKTDCDGVNTPCVYGPNEVGEITANIDTLVTHQFPSLAAQFLGAAAPNAFTVHGDDAPTFYLAKKGTGGGALAQTDPQTREFERSIANLTAVNPYTGATDTLLVRMADQTGMRALHMMVDADPARNPVFVLFADANYFITDFPASTCETCIGPLFAWNHGDIQKEIATTWIGMVGPGVKRQGVSFDVWTDHTDVRPTILSLVGLKDSYVLDGRTITETLHDSALPRSLREHQDKLERLGAIYKQVNASFGSFNMQVLAASTKGLKSGSSSDDSLYASIQAEIQELTTERDALAAEMKAAIDAAAFRGKAVDERTAARLADKGEDLIERARCMASGARDREHHRGPDGHDHD
jgi:arylsulfatase A-like enzyme